MRHVALLLSFVAALWSPLAVAQAGLEVPEGGYVVSADVSLLPLKVREKRQALLAAAKAGDMDALKAIFDAEPAPPTVSFGGPDDPIAYLKEASADGEGLELLAVLADILEAPYAALDAGDGDPVYVWPYFAAMEEFGTLTPAQLVEAYRVAGYATFEEMREFGGWLWWRAYIGPGGDLQAFVAGD